jgi:peptide/nickel transport system permease protein
MLVIFVAIFAYLLAPDPSTHANFQILPLAKSPPGTQASLLAVPKEGPHEKTGFLMRILAGRPADWMPLPLRDPSSLRVEEGRVYFVSWAGEATSLPLSRFGADAQDLETNEFRKRFIREKTFFLGTDGYGRDLLSRILLGARISLAVGTLAVLIGLGIGIFLGMIAGYFGGRTDDFIMWLISVVWSLPTLLLALALSFVLGRGFWQLFLAIGLSMWVEIARIVRGQIMGIRALPYTEAARAMGFRNMRIMFRHILPNIWSPIIVVAVSNFGAAVLIESGLSFLGIGVEVPVPSWGRMIYEGYTFIVFEQGKWLAFFPGMALIFLVISINLIGIGLRDALDVKHG